MQLLGIWLKLPPMVQELKSTVAAAKLIELIHTRAKVVRRDEHGLPGDPRFLLSKLKPGLNLLGSMQLPAPPAPPHTTTTTPRAFWPSQLQAGTQHS